MPDHEYIRLPRSIVGGVRTIMPRCPCQLIGNNQIITDRGVRDDGIGEAVKSGQQH